MQIFKPVSSQKKMQQSYETLRNFCIPLYIKEIQKREPGMVPSYNHSPPNKHPHTEEDKTS